MKLIDASNLVIHDPCKGVTLTLITNYKSIEYNKTFNKKAILHLLLVILLGILLPVGVPITIAVLVNTGVLISYLWFYAYWISLVPCLFAGMIITDLFGEIKWYNYTPINIE